MTSNIYILHIYNKVNLYVYLIIVDRKLISQFKKNLDDTCTHYFYSGIAQIHLW